MGWSALEAVAFSVLFEVFVGIDFFHTISGRFFVWNMTGVKIQLS